MAKPEYTGDMQTRLIETFENMANRMAEQSKPLGVFVELTGIELRGLIKDGLARLKASAKPRKARKPTKLDGGTFALPEGFEAEQEAHRVQSVEALRRYYQELHDHIGAAAVFKLSSYELQQYTSIGDGCGIGSYPYIPTTTAALPPTVVPG